MANQTFTDGPTLNDGVKMPWLGLGVWKTKEGEEVIQSVNQQSPQGTAKIDTAAIYGNEEGVGQAIRESGVSRDELFITTKVWNDDQGMRRQRKLLRRAARSSGWISLICISCTGREKINTSTRGRH